MKRASAKPFAKASAKPEAQSFFNRELSWLAFNSRVLGEAARPELPLLERFRFLAIASSNLDEFFMIRVSTLRRALWEGSYTCPSGLEPQQILDRLRQSIHELVDHQYAILKKLLPEISRAGLDIVPLSQFTVEDRNYLRQVFDRDVFPVLTPLKADSSYTIHQFVNLRIYAAFELSPLDEPEGDPLTAVVEVPPSLKRLHRLPSAAGHVRLALLGDIIKLFAGDLFPGYSITSHISLRITKDNDLSFDEDDDKDLSLVDALQEVLHNRERSFPVRLEVTGESPRLIHSLSELFQLNPDDVYLVKDGPLDLKSLWDFTTQPGFDALRFDQRQPCPPRDLQGDHQDLFAAIRDHDMLLHHPYESFQPVIDLIASAATDPQVLSIKMTLYRTSGDSPVVNALLRAARAGKQVTVLVELKARFDESQNIRWARLLEEAGAAVIHGISQLKVHCKFLMITRREDDGVRRYLHLGTGNYNEKTANVYTDLSLITARQDIAHEAGLFFNYITGYSRLGSLQHLKLAPLTLKPHFLSLIRRETEIAASGGQGCIIAKINSLADQQIMEALHAAASAGVQVTLIVRGVCMLVPQAGLPIRVISVVGRYLEHSRIFYFRNGGNELYYLASADWMTRNLERRIELLFPVFEKAHKQRLRQILDVMSSDNSHAHTLLPDGSYRAPKRPRKTTLVVDTQACLWQDALDAMPPVQDLIPGELTILRRKKTKG